MKWPLLAAAALISNFAFASDLVLDSKVINLGSLNGTDGDAVSKTFEITRTANTPKKVDVNVTFNYVRDVCVETNDRFVCRDVPTTICRPTSPICDIIYRRVCEIERYCSRYENQVTTAYETFIFEFTLADKLSGNEQEVFAVNFSQRGYSKKLNLSAKAVDAKVEYLITGRGPFAKKGLYFRDMTNNKPERPDRPNRF